MEKKNIINVFLNLKMRGILGFVMFNVLMRPFTKNS